MDQFDWERFTISDDPSENVRRLSETILLMFSMNAFQLLRLEFHPEIRLTCLLLLNICVKSGTRSHGVTDSLKTLSCKSESTNSFALNKSVLLMREEVVITPVRRGVGILSI